MLKACASGLSLEMVCLADEGRSDRMNWITVLIKRKINLV